MTSNTIRAGIAAAALLIAPIAAQAADLHQPAFKSPAFEPTYANWTGFYIGINGGYGFGSSDWSGPAIGTSPKGPVVGGTLGYNLQTGVWVWGVEGDIDWSDIKGDAACGIDSCQTKNDWLATVRGRIGYAGWSGLMPYITAGGAAGDIKATESVLGSATKTRTGWGPPAPASNTRSGATCRSRANISTSTSARSTAAFPAAWSATASISTPISCARA
jgi:outer membrane immunogenic protein